MNIRGSLVLASLAVATLTGCYGATRNAALPVGQAAYKIAPSVEMGEIRNAIRPGDRLSIKVLGEPDLSTEQAFVDGAGMVQIALVGEIRASGRTPLEVRDEVQKFLGARYVRDPQVVISILEHAKQAITVEGEVQHAGLYEAPPGLTLIGAVALAQSTTKDAALDEVVVFREVDGEKLAARFNFADIRVGKAPDPQIISGDTVVVGRSAIKSIWHDFLQTAPLFNLFYVLR